MKLEVDHVFLSYGRRQVLDDLSFGLESGEMVGLIGPNGCGKTTIIKALSRVVHPDSGRVTLNGVDLRQISGSIMARRLAVVPQNPFLPEAFTVAEMVLLGRNPHLGWFRTEGSKDLAIAWWAMEKTEISHLAPRRMAELSGGERQRVTIARALAQEPEAILLDEPTANLDINHQLEVLDLIRNLCHEKNLMVLIALHDLNLAAQYCSRLILMAAGKIYAQGSPGEVITANNIKKVYRTESLVYPHPENELPVVLLTSGRFQGVEAANLGKKE